MYQIYIDSSEHTDVRKSKARLELTFRDSREHNEILEKFTRVLSNIDLTEDLFFAPPERHSKI